MTDASISTTTSGGLPKDSSQQPETPQLKAPKDKTCPFCGQAFTSSSLGRHLDLFIRPKKPKAPDGKHDVDEIRRIRGNITRRNMKGPKREREGVSPSVSRRASADDDASPPQSPIDDDDEDDAHTPEGPASRALGAKSRDRSRQKAALELRQRGSAEMETGRAAELALKELLQSVREARCVLFFFICMRAWKRAEA